MSREMKKNMNNHDEIRHQLKDKLVELFELDEADLTPNARLYEDLDIDSVDTVDLMVELKKYLGKDLTPKLFKDARTIDDVVNVIAEI